MPLITAFAQRRPVGRFAFRCKSCLAAVEPMEFGLWIDELGSVLCGLTDWRSSRRHDGHEPTFLDHPLEDSDG